MHPDDFRDNCAASMLCAAAGFADAVGFVHLNVFAANMTGNTVLAGLALANRDWAAFAERVLTLLTFFLGAMLGRGLLHLGRQRVVWPLLAEAAMLGLALLCDPKHALSLWLIAAAMGLQATAITKFRGAAVSTVVITSTMARLAEAAVDRLAALFGRPRGAPGAAVNLLLLTWLFYAVGAMVAVLLMPVVSQPLLVPLALVLLLVLWFARLRPKAAPR